MHHVQRLQVSPTNLIGIIGVGGTGSYVLDQVAKTPVSEIHLFDGDVFCQHNAFRAPGAPTKEILELSQKKVDYLSELYGHMHKGIVAHPTYVNETNVEELSGLDFVFLCLLTQALISPRTETN